MVAVGALVFAQRMEEVFLALSTKLDSTSREFRRMRRQNGKDIESIRTHDLAREFLRNTRSFFA